MTITSSSSIASVNLLLMTILQTSQPPSNTTTQNPGKDLNPFQMPSKTPATDLLHSLDDLHLNFHHDDVDSVSTDFGNIHTSSSLTVLHPNSTSDIAALVRRVFELGRSSPLTVAARGHGHSLNGQSGTERGIVVRMESLMKSSTDMRILRSSTGVVVEVSGGALWIEVLKESLKHGLAPKSWTDYLYLSVGGTLSNAGISGQAFKHGPQISNVQELEVVTGKGEIVNCSESNNSDLFHAVLGGLGQFGIITKARIALEPAPKKVKWIRVLYSDFMEFTGDQEMLISGDDNGFDYIEGFVIINKTGLLNNWRTSFNPKDPVQASQFESHGKTLYCLEMTKNFNPEEEEDIDKEIERLLAKLRFIPSTLFITEVSYLEFLDRVHTSELKLQEEGLWEVPHPWLNLLIPKSKIHQFAHGVFGNILTDSSSGPILMYPLNKRRWSDEISAVTPNEDIFYLVAFLSSASKSLTEGPNSVQKLQLQNRKVLEFCEKEGLGMKQYLPHYTKQEDWKAHYGSKWERFVQRKMEYDPLAILGPGHKIFKKSKPFS